MSLKIKKILNINITINSKAQILEEIQKYLGKTRNSKLETRKNNIKPLVIFTPNPEIIIYAQKDDYFMRTVNTAQITLPDGAGVVWAIKKLHKLKIEKIAGTDLMSEMLFLAQKERVRTALIGGRPGVAVAAAECLRKIYPKLDPEVFDAPEMEVSRITYHVSRITKKIRNTKYLILNTGKNDKQTKKYFQSLAKKIINRRIGILFVALGFPKQEYFVDRIRYYVSGIKYDKPLILMAVGGAFDYISGAVPRAPLSIRSLGLEWLFRLLLEPWRFPRQLRGASFFWRVFNS